MVVALDQTLRARGISTLLYKGQWDRVVGRKTTGTDIFIGAGVTEFGETQPSIDLCAEIEALLGIVLGLVPHLETIPALGPYYNDEDQPFAAGLWVHVGIPRQGMVFLICSETNTTIRRSEMLKCVDGVWQVADTNDNYQMIAEEAVTAAANTRKYFFARWVKN